MGLLSEKIYQGLIEQKWLGDEEYRKKVKRSEGLTASGLPPFACRRALWYFKKRSKPDEAYEPDPVLLSKFRDGNEAHERLGELLRESGVKVVDREFGVTFKGIYARVDYKIKIDRVYNLEFKTSGDDEGFATFCKYGISAFPGYYGQCQVIAGAQPQFPLIFMMKNKGSSAYEDELIEPDLDYQSKLEKMNREFCNLLVIDTPPDRDFGYGSTSCYGCEFRYKCWFSHIRAETLLERNLSGGERKAINHFLSIMDTNEKAYGEYIDADGELRNYAAFLHTKHAVSKVRLKSLTSSLVITKREFPDALYIKSLLKPEQQELAFRRKTSKFFRTVIYGREVTSEEEPSSGD